MDKEKLKKYSSIAILCLAVILLSITYFFFLYKNQRINETIGNVIAIVRPIIIGAVIAYIMKSTCNFFERLFVKALSRSGKRDPKSVAKTSNILSVICAYIIWIIAISLLLWIAIPQIIKSVITFYQNLRASLPGYIDFVVEWERTFLADNDFLRSIFDQIVEKVTTWASEDLIKIVQDFALKQLLPGLTAFAGILIDAVIGFIISIFILLGRKTLAKKSMLLLHCIFKKDNYVKAVADEFKYADRMFSGFLEGKVIDSTIIGILYYITLEILNVPYAPLVAVICGVTNIIPIFGPFIGAIPSGFIILTAEPLKVIPFIIFVLAIQLIDGYIIDPHIVGGNIKLSSFSVVFAVILFGGLWGFVGLLVGVPTFAVIYDIVKKISLHTLRKRGKQELIDNFYADQKKKKKNTNRNNNGYNKGGKNNKNNVQKAANDPAKIEEQSKTEAQDKSEAQSKSEAHGSLNDQPKQPDTQNNHAHHNNHNHNHHGHNNWHNNHSHNNDNNKNADHSHANKATVADDQNAQHKEDAEVNITK